MTIYNNMKILDTGLEREHFTKHGLHLNSSGKDCIALWLEVFSTKREDVPYLLTVER
jgi:hypothetical protein